MNLYNKAAQAADAGGTITVVRDDTALTLRWSELLQEASETARWMRKSGVDEGSLVLTAGRTSIDHLRVLLATWSLGATVSISAIPIRARRTQAMRERFRQAVNSVNPSLIFGDSDHLQSLISDEPNSSNVVEMERVSELHRSLAKQPKNPISQSSGVEKDIAILQLTSGTTGLPKVAKISHRSLDANHSAIIEGLDLRGKEDTWVSWLPLAHDMGLIGLFGTPLVSGSNLVIADPSQFANRPWRWMQWCSSYEATITGGPSFAYSIAAAFLKNRLPGDLSRLRVLLNGSEQVDVVGNRQLLEIGSSCGLREASMFPVYGLAEATLAVTFPPLSSGLRSERLERNSLEHDLAVPTTTDGSEFAVLGSTVRGMELRVVQHSEEIVGEGHIGEVEIRGSSVIPGYLEDPFPDGGWFSTGDRGYLIGGELVICGRSSDVLQVAGRKVYPEEIERAITAIDGLWRQNVAIFGVSDAGREVVVVVAEATEPGDLNLARAIKQTASDWSDIRVADVVLIPPGAIPKTPSGKISRSRCRELYLRGSLGQRETSDERD
jgi:fatty-acyl-CoA synthase